MAGINKSLFDFVELGIIASGGDPNGDGDHPKDESSNQKVILPSTHDPKNVKQEHLAFSPMLHSPTQHSQQSFQGVLDPGSLVYFLKFPGQNQGVILGQANDLVNYNQGNSGGGKNLLGDSFFTQLFDRETGVNIPPNIQESEEKGAKVRKVKDKGKKHKHSLLKGLPSHGATQQISGYQLPQLKNIPTAKQDFQSIMTNQMGDMMPGNIMSLGSMFSGLMGSGGATGGGGGGGGGASAGGGGGGTSFNGATLTNASFSVTTEEEAVQGSTANTYIAGTTLTRMDYILSNLSPEMQDALNSMSILVQGMESEGSNGSFALSSTVHAETYLDNATELLSQVTSVSDLMTVMNRLQWDTSLFGQEKLEPVAIPAETTWGSGNQLLYANGDVVMVYANTDAANAEAAFYTVMSSNGSNSVIGGGASSGGASGAPSGTASGGNMFGSGASSMMDMLKRLTPENADIAKQLMQRVNSGTPEQLMQDVIKKATGGGNPLSFLQNLV